MDRAEEQLLRGRVYATDHGHPGPLPHRDYAELVGGPLDGLLLDLTDWTADELQSGAALTTELGQFGAGGRALYDPRPGEPNRWDWSGDSPRRPGPTRPADRPGGTLEDVTSALIVVHRPSHSGGRRVTAHRGGRDEILGRRLQ
ncbi:hypothetical protein SALBM135S_09772 [Streptomyces alboniger]